MSKQTRYKYKYPVYINGKRYLARIAGAYYITVTFYRFLTLYEISDFQWDGDQEDYVGMVKAAREIVYTNIKRTSVSKAADKALAEWDGSETKSEDKRNK